MTWTAPAVDIPAEPLTGAERPMLDALLDRHRATFLAKCAELTGTELATASAPPSTLTLLGLIRHLADVERVWCRVRADGQDVRRRYAGPPEPGNPFDDLDPARAEAEYAALGAEMEQARRAVAGKDLDHVFVHERRGEMSLRWLLLHLVEEYAQHNGHADLLRERIDGSTSA
ncbi:DinB family protein [Nocardia sp. NRRL S-836]|uniref:DinB family protein n=1 Tax=Nocardia sp. NRRL S-836 TaxID=1519492 RepID=UPI0006B01753|nr:DinB family protein [Nocardia sp. NRRL S-836]KOV85017.1 Mini-circle protein [Nocardia sp. NRRL S-836]